MAYHEPERPAQYPPALANPRVLREDRADSSFVLRSATGCFLTSDAYSIGSSTGQNGIQSGSSFQTGINKKLCFL